MRNFSSEHVRQAAQKGLPVRARSKAVALPLNNSNDARRCPKAYSALVALCVVTTVVSICISTLMLHVLERGAS
ncbi:MAG: hypothetical protein VX104_07530 [Planctomycetota bacterium]|nr:hypothetical protein [Planctomycetota bacterium]